MRISTSGRPSGGAAASIVAEGESAAALRALLGAGRLPTTEHVLQVLDMAEQATGGTFGLTARLNHGAAEVERVVALAHRTEPNGLDRATFLSAHQTVEHVTEHLFSTAELAAIVQGSGIQDCTLNMVRRHLLRGSGLLDASAPPGARQRLDHADQASRPVEWPDFDLRMDLRDQEVVTRDRQHHAQSNINLRLGLVLLDTPTPMTAADLRAWFQQHRPDVLQLARRQARVLGALGESYMAGCNRVHSLLQPAIECAGANRLANGLGYWYNALFDLAMEIQREA